MKYKYNGQWVDVNIKALDSMVIGSVIQFVGTTIPTGWLECDGSSITQEAYPELYALIGGTLPNFKGKVLVGQDTSDTDFDTLLETGGSKYLQQHKHLDIEIASNHLTSWNSKNGSTGIFSLENLNSQNGTANENYLLTGNVHETQTGNSGNLQPYAVVKHIIKAKNTTPTMASIVNATNNSTTDAYSCDYINGKTGVVLYESSEGTYTDVNLSDNISNYNYLEIYATTNSNSHINCNKVALNVISDKIITISNFENAYYRYADYELGTNKLTLQNTYGYYELLTGNHSTSQNYIKIVKVVGYK